ncbi:hypothetical protein AKJ41_01110 [candidate division MSBL1 archaeon SCGC-AAA259O05]|uniref:HTH arsR-type domain-containing protein n=1 Tax=candidate division MSBL1 archaeon SCGC-AAA259O05 TaxID=1698271 RepID=A0A133V546_9EURY|nr:hypothetical protein AKJ41_01110 [candidate division MSBL1 archaeon SCGC-AAA259O05]
MTEEKGKVPLLKVLGVSPELRVLNALLDNPVFNLTAGEISDISGLKVAEVEEVLNKLRSWNIVEIKCEGEKKCYSLNTSSDAVQHLGRFDIELARQRTKEG